VVNLDGTPYDKTPQAVKYKDHGNGAYGFGNGYCIELGPINAGWAFQVVNSDLAESFQLPITSITNYNSTFATPGSGMTIQASATNVPTTDAVPTTVNFITQVATRSINSLMDMAANSGHVSGPLMTLPLGNDESFFYFKSRWWQGISGNRNRHTFESASCDQLRNAILEEPITNLQDFQALQFVVVDIKTSVPIRYVRLQFAGYMTTNASTVTIDFNAAAYKLVFESIVNNYDPYPVQTKTAMKMRKSAPWIHQVNGDQVHSAAESAREEREGLTAHINRNWDSTADARERLGMEFRKPRTRAEVSAYVQELLVELADLAETNPPRDM